MKSIQIEAAHTQEQVESHQCDIVEDRETIKDATKRAKYFLTDDYQRSAESSEPFRYARIIVDGEIHSEFWRKGYTGE